jgi:hypothetical protein
MPDSADLFDEWYIHVFHCNRYKYFLITNAATLFTVILHGKGIRDDIDLLDRMFSAIRDQGESQFMFEEICNMKRIVRKLRSCCSMLRDDGLSYGDYVE